jgi:hypothetical protein
MVFPPEESARRREIRLGKRPAADVSRLQNQGEQNILILLIMYLYLLFADSPAELYSY